MAHKLKEQTDYYKEKTEAEHATVANVKERKDKGEAKGHEE